MIEKYYSDATVKSEYLEKRDYDKNPIKIIDYGVLFEISMGILLIIVVTPLLIINISECIDKNSYLSFLFFKTVVLILIGMSILYIFFIRDPKRFKYKKSYYELTNEKIEYMHPGVTTGSNNINLEVDLSDVDYVDYCLVSELRDRYGRFHKWNAWKLYRKSSIGVHIGKVTIFLYYTVVYILLALPYKVWFLQKNKEKLNLLSKNLVIHFKNRNYILINIYSKKDLEEILVFFNKKSIKVRDKLHFIPHLQNQGWFVDKEEKWSNNFIIEGKK